jgi:hypothetical protein
MTYLEVVNVLSAATDVVAPNGFFIHGKRPDASLFSIQTNFPIIWALPFRENYNLQTGKIERQLTVCFFLQDSTNNTLAQRQALIQEAWDFQHDFMEYLDNYMPKAFNISDIIATPEYAQLAGTVSGYSVSFKFQSKLVSC